MESISLTDARTLIEAAKRPAVEIGCPMDVAVVDAGGNLKTHIRMDGAFVGSIAISIDKAWTSVAFKCRTADLPPLTQSGSSIFGLNHEFGVGRDLPRRRSARAGRGDSRGRRRLYRDGRAGRGRSRSRGRRL